MEWDASLYREEVVGSAESKDTLGLIGMNFNQVRGTVSSPGVLVSSAPVWCVPGSRCVPWALYRWLRLR
ncbi:hypothetical protein DPMN_117061 [Dreissena polymorpha]|uniref:Uncharacterized protein n=1 Tax=Dreissena polymorpha TaxID=45954 RepID=A0A9D4QTZ0_DREPO|nr:hypothetical protein DPMN_117061 [Dreissena polymorpha]